MPSAKSLTWIHLSDLHFGHGKDAATRFDQKAVTAAIVSDAVQVASELGAPDVVFVTGDIAFSASSEQYDQAAEWLGKLLEALKIGPERVPGNHDVDRKKAVAGHSDLVHEGLRAKPDKVNELLEKADTMATIWPKLAAYETFARAYGSPTITAAQPFWTHQFNTDLGLVKAIGLNTTLLSFDGGDSQENLALGLGQLQRALETPVRDALYIVLQHHTPNWLRDGQLLRAMLKERAHILLCGHVHEQGGFVDLPFASRGNVELVAGAGHQDAGEGGEHAYAWGRLHHDGLDYFPRAWFRREPSFLAQRIRPPDGQKGYTSKLGEYVAYPRAKLPEALAAWIEKRASHASTAPAADSISGSVALRASAPAVATIVTAAPAPASGRESPVAPATGRVSTTTRAELEEPKGGLEEPKGGTPAILSCVGLSKQYPAGFTLPAVDLTVHHGQIVGVVGHNGTGKTTLLRMLAGDLAPTTGVVDMGSLDAGRRPLLNPVTFVQQSPPPYGGTLLEHLRQQAAFFGYDELDAPSSKHVARRNNATVVRRAVARLALESQLGKAWNELSGGYKIRAAIAVALVAQPGLVLLDEPLAPLDPLAQNALLGALWKMARDPDTRTAVVMSSQHVMELEQVADEMILLHGGRAQPYSPRDRPSGTVFEIMVERVERKDTRQRKEWTEELERDMTALKCTGTMRQALFVEGRIVIELAAPHRIAEVSSLLGSRTPVHVRDITGSALAVMYDIRRSMAEEKEKHERTGA